MLGNTTRTFLLRTANSQIKRDLVRIGKKLIVDYQIFLAQTVRANS
jgi:hypothetical protein